MMMMTDDAFDRAAASAAAASADRCLGGNCPFWPPCVTYSMASHGPRLPSTIHLNLSGAGGQGGTVRIVLHIWPARDDEDTLSPWHTAQWSCCWE